MIKCIYTHIDGLNSSKGNLFNIVVRKENSHVIFLTETKLSDIDVSSQSLDCDTYNVFRRDRLGRGDKGVMILVCKDLAVQEWQDDTWNNIETVACQVKFGEQKLFVGCIYRPPNSPIDYNEIVRQTILKISNSHRGQVLTHMWRLQF